MKSSVKPTKTKRGRPPTRIITPIKASPEEITQAIFYAAGKALNSKLQKNPEVSPKA